MLRKILAIMLCLLLLCPALTGCSGNTVSKNDRDEREEEENDEEHRMNSRTIKIGMSGPLTGNAAVYGWAVKNSAQMAVDEINAAGGLNGYELELIATDDAHDASKVSANYASMIAEGMQVSLGCVTSTPCLEFAKLSSEDNLFFMTPSASAEAVAAEDNAYQMCFTDDNQGSAAAQYVNSLDYQKIGIFYKTGDAYSEGIRDQFLATLDTSKFEVVEANFTEANSNDFSAQIDTLKDCEFIFMPIFYTPAAVFMVQARDKIAADATYFGCDGFDGIATMEGFDINSIPQQIMMLCGFNIYATEGSAKDYIDRYTDLYGSDTLSQFGACGYDAVYSLYEAMKVAVENGNDITPSTSASELCEMLKDVYQNGFTYSGITGENISWYENGMVNKSPIVFVIKDSD